MPLAAELLWRGAFERGSRAVALARQCRIDPGRQPELAVRLALVNMLHCAFIGQFDEALAHREWARPVEATADGVSDWIVTLDTLAMYCHTYLGQFGAARQLVDALASAQLSAPLTEVLCPGVISQVAFLEGALDEAGALAAGALAAARRLGFDRHYFNFPALRTTALLALERGDLAAAASRSNEPWRWSAAPGPLRLPGPAGPGPDLGGGRQPRGSPGLAAGGAVGAQERPLRPFRPGRRARSPPPPRSRRPERRRERRRAAAR